MTKSVKRLFEQFVPENYKLEITPDANKMLFTGTLVLKGKKVGRPSRRITLHQKGLTVTDVIIQKHVKTGAEELSVDRINSHKAYDEVRLHTKEMIYPGHYTITLQFSGKITKQMTGLYPCFFEKDGRAKKLLATQFESHHAREVFPCIDEPEAKATFDLILNTPVGDEVLSNMPVLEQDTSSSKLTRTVFETSPIMSTYLLAFVTGDMHYVEAKTKSGTLMRSWATTAQPKGFLNYANNEAVAVLEFFEEFFDTPFPLKKCDQVALPDFESGAMENWGLVTYREVALLADPDNRSVSSEQYVSMVVAHELSHQWFGNLVTMKWWDDLWLNESFASLMEHIALAKLHPDWHQWEQYVSSDVIACSNRDIYKDVQPVRVDVHHPEEIGSLFDPAIVYAKGGRLLKMMLEYIGEDAFRKGLKSYFSKHAYKNTTRDDLWTEMSAASGKNINDLMDPWLEQSGMPVIRVEGNGDERTLTQSRFVLDAADDTQKWPVPLLADPKLAAEILQDTSTTIQLSGGVVPLLNAQGSGHFIAHYASDEDLAQLIGRIKSGDVTAEARINILNDLLLLARRGDDSLVDALKLIAALDTEPRDAVWAIMTRGMGLAYNLGEDESIIEDGLKKLRFTLAHKNHAKLGWDDAEDDDPNTKMLRATMVGLMLGAEDTSTIEHAIQQYKTTPIEDLPADRRGMVLGAVVRHGNNPADIDRLIEEYKTNQNQDIQMSLSGALTHTRDPKVIERLIPEALGPDGFVRDQDVFRWFAYLMRSKHTRGAAWQWLTSSWDRIEKDFGDSKSLDYFVVYAATPLQTKEWEKRFHEFFGPKRDMIALTRKIDIAYAEISARAAWRTRDLERLKDFFKSVQ